MSPIKISQASICVKSISLLTAKLSSFLFVMLLAAATHSQSMLDFALNPPLSENSNNIPMIMLSLSADHQLFIKAYNDYDDVGPIVNGKVGDGVIDTTYKSDIEYVGYFDPKKCYTYSPGDATLADDVFVIAGNADASHYCVSGMAGKWSGNFLNWVSMTRVDVVRLVLYGGYRSTDDANRTVLERSYLPQDAHSFAKYYRNENDDLSKLVDTSSLGTTCPEIDNITGECEGYTFCNTSKPVKNDLPSQKIRTEVSPPLLRVVKGNYSLWASSERFQCLAKGDEQAAGDNNVGKNRNNQNLIGGQPIHNESPDLANIKDFIVRAEVCGSLSANGAHDCRSYGANKKPVGLMQTYDQVEYGLMTKGFYSNKKWGVLRKNVSSFDDEVKADGTFTARPITNASFVTPPTESTIIGNLNALRVVDYFYDHPSNNGNLNGTYFNEDVNWNNGNFAAGTDCAWSMSVFDNGKCKSWGNPFGEILAESYRYFSGANAPSVAVDSREVNLVPGLSAASWTGSPAGLRSNDDLACVNMNVLAFNASTVSYDSDDLRNVTTRDIGIGSAADSELVGTLTDAVGIGEGIDGNYFVGRVRNSNVDEGICTAKALTTATNLSAVRGTCPDGPRTEGAYFVAGLAHYVYTHDVIDREKTGNNYIATFGVNLAGDIPKIETKIPKVPSRTVTILPACRNFSLNPNTVGNCAIVDFKVFKRDETNVDSYSGEYFVSYENSEQGGDYDQDLNALIRYTVTATTLTIDTRIAGVSGPDSVEFGFVVAGTGTNADGHYGFSTSANNNIPNTCNAAATARGCTVVDGYQRKIITLNTTAAANTGGKFLETPLYYAAKWGSFDKDVDTVLKPDKPQKWKGDNEEPIGYTAVNNPAQLRDKLYRIFENLNNLAGAGSAAAITSSSLLGEGVMVQGLYHPKYKDSNGKKVTWVGSLNAFFVDGEGRLREDIEPFGTLTAADPIVRLKYVENLKDTRFDRFTLGTDGAEEAKEMNQKLDLLRPLWSARNRLAAFTDDQVIVQRPYGSTLETEKGRHIIVGVDQAGGNSNGVVTGNETIDFVSSKVGVTGGLPVSLLAVDGATDADKLAKAKNTVDYIRGKDIAGFRSRKVTWSTSAGLQTWRLGDIAGSTSAIVERPSSAFDTVFGDETYSRFRAKYKNRRQMVYVGANDGMLHAFNGGFRNIDATGTLTYTKVRPIPDPAPDPALPLPAGGEQELGEEMWAYVPYNLLPHLKWLTEPRYSHVFYVDSDVQTFDVNIFGGQSADVYPDGWGTIIVVGMRFGGSPYTVTAADGTSKTLRSAYVVMDVTNPEVPPKLLAEITDPELGFTFGGVDVVHQRKRNTTDSSYTVGTNYKNEWYLVFGSGPQGPDALTNGKSNAPAKLFYLDLNQLTAPDVKKVTASAAARNALVGGVIAKDWDGNYIDDMLYLGLVGDLSNIGTAQAPRLYRGGLSHATIHGSGNLLRDFNPMGNVGVKDLLDSGNAGLDRAFSNIPIAVRDRATPANYWLFTGTGRFAVKQDLTSGNNAVRDKYFGLKLNNPAYAADNTKSPWLTSQEDPIQNGELHNVTPDAVWVNTDNTFTYYLGGTKVGNGSRNDYKAAVTALGETRGWSRELIGAGEMNVNHSAFNEASVVFDTYTPSVSVCEPVGGSWEYVLDMYTGLPAINLDKNFLFRSSTVNAAGSAQLRATTTETAYLKTMLLGPVIMNNIIQTQDSTGGTHKTRIPPPPAVPSREAWREVPLD